MADSPAVDLRHLDFSWPGGAAVLVIERFTVARGERVFVRGPSGSGKSTLLGLIGGVLTPQAGNVELLGTDLVRLTASARDRFRGNHVGFIFQMFNLVPYLTVLENVVLPVRFSPRRLARIGAGRLREEALRLLEALGLAASTLLDRPVTQLSIGQQQRVAAARALLGRPEIIVADEPTSALDADARAGFLDLLMSECAAIGATLLFVSHDVALGGRFDRTVAMDDVNRAMSAAA
ncbi:MAG TPA: ABC transporter ATP-binding protein [Steroidobacteraceae bacterium]|nr:ABC transporter ATP-binding protein [Steroidobacteraceae bacterium]